MQTASYIASFIANILVLIEPFFKKMRAILIMDFLGNFMVALSYVLVGGMSGAGICFFACVQVFINYLFNIKGKKIPLWLMIVYGAIFVVINLMTFAYWYDALALVGSLIFVVGVAQSDAKYYRILLLINSIIWLSYDILAKAYGNMTTHIILIVAAIVSMVVRDRKKKEN